MPHELAGHNAIITGGSRGLGFVIAEHFLKAGANVVICSRHSHDLTEAAEKLGHKGRLFTKQCDVSNIEDVDYLFDFALNKLHGLDVVVNNAAILGPVGNTHDVYWREWVRTVEVNLMGTVFCSRKAVKAFLPQKSGKIINLTGGGASDPLPRRSAYGVSKAAVVRFTDSLAEEVRPFNIDVNAVAPGPMATDMFDDIIAAGRESLGDAEYQTHVEMKANGLTPPELAAGLCVYLASTKSNGITGKMLAARWDPWPFTEQFKQKLKSSDLCSLRRVNPEREAILQKVS